MPIFERGSEWRKCDLHIHTPLSIKNNYGGNTNEVWDKFISDLENTTNYPEGSVIGISDYYFLDGYDKVMEYKNSGRLSNISKIFPVIELRLKEFGGSNNKISRINFHVLFNPDKYTSQQIQDHFISAITGEYQLSPEYTEQNIKWNNCLTRESLTELGKKIKATVPEVQLNNYGSDFEEGFNNFNLAVDKLYKILERNDFKNNTICFVGKTEWNDIKWNDNSIAEKKHIVNKAHFLFCSYDNIDNYDTDVDYLKNSKVNTRIIDCSDAHNFSDAEDKDKLGKCYTWIKGKPCFETIRQAVFSYDTRIKIVSEKPIQAVNTIDDVTLTFPETTQIGENKLCFAGKTIKLHLNPALNCFIGGRGTGKSLLLQLLCKNNEDFLPKDERKNIVSKIKDEWKNYVDIDGTKFEYFGQGTIENSYENQKNFKQTISQRLEQFWETEDYTTSDVIPTHCSLAELIQNKDHILQETILNIQSEIELLKIKIQNKATIIKLHEEYAAKEKIVNTFKEKQYLDLQSNIAKRSKQVSVIDEHKTILQSFLSDIEQTIKKHELITISEEQKDIAYYANIYNNLLKSFSDLFREQINLKTDNKWSEKEKDIRTDLDKQRKALKDYLIARDMSKNNIQDAMLAQKDLNDIIFKIQRLETENEKTEQNFDIVRSQLIKADKEYKEAVKQVLRITKDKIVSNDPNNSEIALLSFDYEYDEKSSMNDFFDFIKESTGIERFDHFQSILEKRNSEEKENADGSKKELDADILEKICHRESGNSTSCQKILAFFDADPLNKRLYNLEYLLHKYNGAKYKNFTILYQNKTLEELSFGQRATAIILTMIVFGNKPIIIDEPETHLDQKTIANEIVDVIKKAKTNKQIIFATHNANIVINADAEQIYVLNSEIDGTTDIEQMSIEDVYEENKREKLLMLEGSEQAFKKREEKYSI